MWNECAGMKVMQHDEWPPFLPHDMQVTLVLPSPFNWGIKSRGPEYLEYLEKSYGRGSDKKYPIEKVATDLILSFEQPRDARGFRKGLEYMNNSIEIINNQQMPTVFKNVCWAAVYATKCIINYMLGSHADAKEDLKRSQICIATLSSANAITELSGLKALVLFEQRTQFYIQEAKILLESMRHGSEIEWFWSYIYLRVIRHERELSKPRNYMKCKEIHLFGYLIRAAPTVNDLLRLIIMYRRAEDLQKLMSIYHRKFPETNKYQVRIQFFNKLLNSFKKWQLIALNELTDDDALPIPNTINGINHVIHILKECSQRLEITMRGCITNYLYGLIFETIDISKALRCYLACGTMDLNFDCDLNAAILKVKLGQAEDPVDDFQNMLLKYERRDLKMLLLVNIGYHLYYDRKIIEAGVHYWNQALEVDICSPLLKHFYPIIPSAAVVPDGTIDNLHAIIKCANRS